MTRITSFLFVSILLMGSVHATDYTRMARDIARESVSQGEDTSGDVQRFVNETQQQASVFDVKDFAVKAASPAPLYNPLKMKAGKTCRASKMRSTAPKARYQGDKGLYVFVSLSLSDEALKTLSRQAKAVGGNLVIQGLVDNSFKATQQRLRALGIPIDIDPTLFERFEVTRMPTFVLTAVNKGEIGGPYDKVTGHTSVHSALELFARDGELRDLAQSLLHHQQEAAT